MFKKLPETAFIENVTNEIVNGFQISCILLSYHLQKLRS